jgi:DNA mismatch repair protein MutL
MTGERLSATLDPEPTRTIFPSAPIQVLPPQVVERIAAGEVIERPVSVVRELLDNALDAGARDVRIDVRGGGLRSIRVVDDGAGIPADQIDLAFQHHATSKIRGADDLVEVASLGFRGEALPSIAVVSELSIATAQQAARMGVRVDLRGGDVVNRAYLSRTPGTTVTVRNLFANVPVRLKFMGDARTESRLISQLVRRYALAHPDVRFQLSLDGHPSLRTSGHGLDQTMGEVFGATVSQALLPLGPLEAGAAELRGWLTGRHVTRGSHHHVTLLVNNRWVKSRLLLGAFEEGYRPLLPRGRHPIALLSLSVPRSHLDVNVHPSKAEVKIRDEAAIAARLKTAVREQLGRNVSLPSSDLSFALSPTQFELPSMVAERGPEWEVTSGRRLRDMQIVGQVHGSLILVEDERGLYLIDQHRSHERALYELLCRQHAEGRAGQLLLEPLHVELSGYQVARLEPRLAELAALGFSCEWFGGRSFLVRSVPVIPETADLASVVEDLLDLAADDESDWQHRLLTSVACRAATRRGRSLSLAQCRELVDLLADTESPAVCPHGSPIILHFSDRFLERQFDW